MVDVRTCVAEWKTVDHVSQVSEPIEYVKYWFLNQYYKFEENRCARFSLSRVSMRSCLFRIRVRLTCIILLRNWLIPPSSLSTLFFESNPHFNTNVLSEFLIISCIPIRFICSAICNSIPLFRSLYHLPTVSALSGCKISSELGY